MRLRLIFIQRVMIFFTGDTIYAVYFTSFCIYYLKNYLGYLATQSLFGKQSIKLEVLLGFDDFQIVAHEFLRCQFLENNRIFHFGQVLILQRNFRGNLHWPHVLFLDGSPVYFQNLYSSIWLQTLSNKLRNFQNCKKMRHFCIFSISLIFSSSRDAVKQLCHS